MDGVNLTLAGWIVVAVLVAGGLLLAVRYFASVAVELTRVLLVAGVIVVIGLVIWLFLR